MRISQFLNSVSHLALASATTLPLTRRVATHASSLTSTLFGTVFDVPMTIGNQTFQMLVDTGSSDTYVMREGYKCINSTDNQVIGQSECLYNSSYHVSDTYREVPGEIFGIEYGAGIASGVMAYEDVTLNGITAKGQKIGVADRSNPMGDGVNSGLLGLSYPSITSAHPSNRSSNETFWYNRLPYSPLLYTMHEQGLLEDPYFSITLARTPQNQSTGFGGYLTLGGLPPVKHSPHFAVAPVELTKGIPLNYTSGNRVRSYWSMTISGATYGSASSPNNRTTNSTPFQAFLDVGNNLNFLPSEIAESVNSLFSPPAKFDVEAEAYIVDCSAKAPAFGLKIANQTFFHNGADLIYRLPEGICVSAIANSDSVSIGGLTLNIIGASFLKNVVAVFDFGKDEMRFAKLLGGNVTHVGTGNSTPSASGSSSSGVATPTLNSEGSSWRSQPQLLLAVVLCVAILRI